jgi:hypothetical protein
MSFLLKSGGYKSKKYWILKTYFLMLDNRTDPPMLYEFRLPKINPNMSAATLECIYVQPGTLLKSGDKLFDLSVDLSSGYSQYCPPISYFRVVMREKLWLQKTMLSLGDSCEVGSLLALFTAEKTDSIEDPPTRTIRIATAGIAHHQGLWSANRQ